MPKQPQKPWYRKERKCWYVQIDGKQVRLHEDREKANDKFHRLMLQKKRRPVVEENTVWDIFGKFSEWLSKNRAKLTYQWYQQRLQKVIDGIPNCFFDEMKTHDLQKWLDGKKWSSWYKRGMVRSVKSAFNWAVGQNLITHNPIGKIQLPPKNSRDQFLSLEEFEKLLAKLRCPRFRDVLRFLWYTGARPQELAKIEARHVHPGLVIFSKEESKGGVRERIIFLPHEAEEIAKRLSEANPDGPIFRNSRNARWRANNFCARFRVLEKKLGSRYCMYSIRHSFSHHALTKANLSPEVVASLMGHTDTKQIMQTYGHLLQNRDFMSAAAKKAVGSVSPPKKKPVEPDDEEQRYGGA